MNRSEGILARNEAILQGIIIRAEAFCPRCKALIMEAIQAGSEQNEV